MVYAFFFRVIVSVFTAYSAVSPKFPDVLVLYGASCPLIVTEGAFDFLFFLGERPGIFFAILISRKEEA